MEVSGQALFYSGTIVNKLRVVLCVVNLWSLIISADAVYVVEVAVLCLLEAQRDFSLLR
jgi:uncharacterized membrane protein